MIQDELDPNSAAPTPRWGLLLRGFIETNIVEFVYTTVIIAAVWLGLRIWFAEQSCLASGKYLVNNRDEAIGSTNGIAQSGNRPMRAIGRPE